MGIEKKDKAQYERRKQPHFWYGEIIISRLFGSEKDMQKIVSVCIYLPDRGSLKNQVQIIGNGISDGTVAGTFNVTAFDDIPEGDMIFQKQLCLLRFRDRQRRMCQLRYDAPETVAGMTVIEILLSGLY